MLTADALEIVLTMAHGSYSKSFGPTREQRVALEEVEVLLESYETHEDYDEN